MGRRIAVLVALVLVAWFAWRWFSAPGDGTPPTPPTHTTTTGSDASPQDPPRTRARAQRDAAAAAEATAPAPPAVPAGPTLTGRVIDADGRPVPGASVVTHPDDLSKPVDRSKSGADGTRTFGTQTDSEGRFEVRIDPAAVQAILTATADAGFGQAAASPKDRDVQIRLLRWTLLSGKVTNKASEPVAGAKVTAHFLLDAMTEDHAAVTDANGEYRMERLPPVGWSPDAPYVGRGRHAWVIAEAEGYAPLLVPVDQLGGPRPGDPSKRDLVLVRGMTLTGKVVDGDTKAGVAGATVVCWSVEGMMGFSGPGGTSIRNPWGPRPLGETRTADDGTFRFEHLPAEGPNGVASSNSGKRGRTLGHVAAWKEGYVHGGDEVPVSRDEAVVESTIELWPAATITGRVVDRDTKPVAGATVWANVADRRPALNGFPSFYAESERASPKTDADGRYVLSSFRASHTGPTTGTVSAYARMERQGASSPQVYVTAAAGTTVEAPDLVIDFGETPRAVFVVTDESGAPVIGALIERGMGRDTGRTGLDGRAVVSVEPGSRTWVDPVPAQLAVVRARGFGQRKVEFTPTRGTPVEIPVVMKPGARIAGRVQTADGLPAAKASIVVTDGTRTAEELFDDRSRPGLRGVAGSPFLAMVTVAADGTFVADDLPDGPYLVAAQMPSRAPTGFTRRPKVLRDVQSGVRAGATDLVFTIPADDAPPTQALDVEVTDAAGRAVERCWVFAVAAGARLPGEPTEPTKFRVAAVPVGVCTIEVTSPGWRKAVVRDVAVPSDAPPAPVVVRMDRGVTLRGTVRVEGGTLPDSGSVVVIPFPHPLMEAVPVGELHKDGSFDVSGLAPGRYRVTVIGGPDSTRPVGFVPSGDGIVTIAEDVRDVVLDLVFVSAGTISFFVQDARLPPAPFGGTINPEKERFSAGSRLEVADPAGTVVYVHSPLYADVGSSTFVAPGEYTVRVHLPDAPPQEQRVSVKAGESVSVRFPPR